MRTKQDIVSDALWKMRTEPDSQSEEILFLARETDNVNVIRRLSSHISDDVKCQIAKNIHCPIDILERYANESDLRIVKNVAKNPNISSMLLDTLSKHHNSIIRERVASHPSTSPTTLTSMMIDTNTYVIYALIRNAHTPSHILHLLMGREEPQIKILVARNAAFSEKGFIDIINLGIEYELSVAGNPHLPLNLIQNFASSFGFENRAAVASNPSIPLDILRSLSADKDWRVRKEIAENLSTPEDILYELAEDTHYSVKLKVSHNPNANEETLMALSKTDDKALNRSIMKNPRTPQWLKDIVNLR